MTLAAIGLDPEAIDRSAEFGRHSVLGRCERRADVEKIAQDLDTFRMPVKLHVETEGNPEEKTIEVVGTSSEFAMETFGKPKTRRSQWFRAHANGLAPSLDFDQRLSVIRSQALRLGTH